jgi:glycosyltransferase involved in cell wall biosynthesis
MPGSRISALVVAHNEEAQLGECLQCLAFADEIVVVLDNCTDQSKSIAEAHNCTIIEGNWDIEGERRNLGIDTCTGKWILEVDADERVSPDLAREIREAIRDKDHGFFLVPFHNYIGQRLVRRGWGAYIGTNAKVCLFARGSKRWGPQTIHPELELDMAEYHGRLQQAMIHYIDDNIPDLLRRFNRYTTAMARDPYHAKKLNGFIRNLLRIPARFHKCYIYKKGYHEGLYGLIIALLAGLLPITVYIKAVWHESKNE